MKIFDPVFSEILYLQSMYLPVYLSVSQSMYLSFNVLVGNLYMFKVINFFYLLRTMLISSQTHFPLRVVSITVNLFWINKNKRNKHIMIYVYMYLRRFVSCFREHNFRFFPNLYIYDFLNYFLLSLKLLTALSSGQS